MRDYTDSTTRSQGTVSAANTLKNRTTYDDARVGARWWNNGWACSMATSLCTAMTPPQVSPSWKQCRFGFDPLIQPDDMIHIWLGWLRRVAGTSRCRLAVPADHVPHISDPFAMSVRRFLAESNLSLQEATPTPNTTHTTIMDAVIDLKMSDKDIRAINWVRLHLRVTRLSDLYSADGKRRYTGTDPDSLHSKETGLWPRVGKPGPAGVEAWKRHIVEER